MTKAKILLVDDAGIFLDLQKDFLRFSPVVALTAHNGVEALAIAKAEHPDLIVMDVCMPQMDGISCCRAIKEDPRLSALPVILVVTRSGTDDMESYRVACCDGILHKPLQRREFLNRLYSYLQVIERREPRAPCRMGVSIETRTGAFSGVSRDISVNGIYLSTDSKVEPGSEVVLSFTLPTGNGKVTVVWGRVAWCNNSPEGTKRALPAGFAAEFLEITGHDGIMARSNELSTFVTVNGTP